MTDERLETFIRVAETGSFSKAAEAMFLTPTAVMKQINALEGKLGVNLFERTNRGLNITKAGESFLSDSRYIVEYIGRAMEKARAIDEGEKRRSIRIGTSVMTPARFVLELWSQIVLRMPDLKIELIPFDNNPVNSVEILKNLGQHIDIVAGLYDERFLKERQCMAAHLADKRLLLAVPVTHPMAAAERIAPGDLKGIRVMFIRRGWNRFIDALRLRVEAAGAMTEDFDMFNISAYNHAVADNIPIITVEGWEDIHPMLKQVPADWTDTIPFGVLHSPSPTGIVKRFIDLVEELSAGK